MKSLFLIPLILLLVSCAGTQDRSQNTSSWAGNMQQTAKSFQELLPFLYNEDRFTDKKNTKEIQEKISNYSKNVHRINQGAAEKILGDDPYITQSLKSLNELTKRAEDSFARGDRKNSRILLKATTNTCFKCHTRQKIGPESVFWKNFDVASLDTSDFEKAQILVSMRQYEEAKIHLRKYLSESETDGKFDMSYENALHYYLMISLRGQNTFQNTLNFLTAKSLVVKTPSEFHYTIRHWQKDLKHWIKNKSKLKATPESALMVIKRNAKRYGERNLVNDLIASSLLHQYLMTKPSSLEKAKSYRLLGQVYDELIVEGFWDLPEIYYEMCIDYAPNSKLARNCFKQLKNNITLGYSGSEGTMIPNNEYQRLEKLRKKAGLN